MAIKIVCDRCGEGIEDSTYYTIDIYAKDVRTMFGVSAIGALRNMKTNHEFIFGTEPCYCERCIDSIENFIRNGSVKE